MPAEPPPELVALLSRLGLATRAQVRGVGHRVHRLARELPLFESVWVDALAQARVVTPYQAAQINAGRGEQLLVGPYLLCHRLSSNGLGTLHVARDADTGKLHHLLQLRCEDRDAAAVLQELESLVEDLAGLESDVVEAPQRVGANGEHVWAACRLVEGRVVAEWLVHNGRLPPPAVLEIARRTMPGLLALEARGRVHGDLGARQLLLTRGGEVSLPLPGVRGIVRPSEGYGRADLPPEAFDYLAPERVLAGTPPTTASDLFSLGCLWWHLLAGRPPLAGGDALSKLRSVHVAKIVDVRQFAPDTPTELVEAITACTRREPNERPESMARLIEILGPPTRAGRDALVQCLHRTGGVQRSFRRPRRAVRIEWAPAGKAATAVAAVVLLTLAWLGRRLDEPLPLNNIPGPAVIVSSPSPGTPGQGRGEGQGDGPSDIVLPAGEPLRLRDLPLRAGQRVCGPPGQRPLILVPTSGLTIGCDDVQFDGIDFAIEDNPLAELGKAIVHLRGDRASFHNCTFQGAASLGRQRPAVLWHGAVHAPRSSHLLTTGTLTFAGCAFRNVNAGVECRMPGAARIECSNTLHLGPGPLLRFDRPPGSDPRLISLNQCTLRGATLIEYRYERVDLRSGDTTIDAVGCVFSLENGRGLMAFCGPTDPTALLPSMQWTGEGSVVVPPAALCVWVPPDGPQAVLPDDGLSVSGLVLSQLTFAGDADVGPNASRAERWQAPLQSADPPGIVDLPLGWPRTRIAE